MKIPVRGRIPMVIETPSNVNAPGIDLDQIGLNEKRSRILIIDDDPESVALFKSILINSGFDVLGALDGEEAVQKCLQMRPDAILLDLMMPEMDGWETLEHLRKVSPAPVIIVTALSEKDEVVRGFDSGAEDYLTKPFHPAELVARIRRLLKRNSVSMPSKTFYFPKVDMHLDLDNCEVKIGESTIYLPGKAFDVLAVMARNAPRMVTNHAIAIEVWGEDNARTQNRIKHLIFILRQKLEVTPSEPVLIINRGGLGYRLATEGK